MVRRRMTVTALWDHSVAIANPRVTWRAINVEAFASACEHLIVDRKWHVVARRVADLAGIKIRVGAQIAARHGARDQRPRGACVRKEIAFRQREVFRLDVHVDTAAQRKRQRKHRKRWKQAGSQYGANWAPPIPSAVPDFRETAAHHPRCTWDRKKR